MVRLVKVLFSLYVSLSSASAQQFEKLSFEQFYKSGKPIILKDILTTSRGDMLIIGSIGFAEIRDRQLNFSYPSGTLDDENGNPRTSWPGSSIFKDAYYLHTGFKAIAEGPGQIIYMVSDNNNFGWIDYNVGLGFGMPPFNFPNNIDIRKIWIDRDGDLFVAAADSLYIIKDATQVFDPKTKNVSFKSEFDKDSNIVVTRGAKKIQRFTLGKNVMIFCFAPNSGDDNAIYIGTNHGIYEFEKKTGASFNIFQDLKSNQVTITAIESRPLAVWFSTLENGMGYYSEFSKSVQYYPYKTIELSTSPVQNFIRISDKELLVAASDSLPAIFNTETNNYEFINDTSFGSSKTGTINIKRGNGNITALLKDKNIYVSHNFLKSSPTQKNYPSAPFIREIMIQGVPYGEKMNYLSRLDSLKTIHLSYYENKIDILYAMRGFNSSDTITFAWKLEGRSDQWFDVAFSMLDERINMARFDNLSPGKYRFRVRAKKGSGPWLKDEATLTIIIDPPFWKTWWFWLLVTAGLALLIYSIVKFRVTSVRRSERLKAKHEKDLLELEAKALRAQMNPHFIFNCLNSIKSLIQEDEKSKSVTYLTTFSKLIRTLFNNADKKAISLFDEIETCKYYLQLESMRFDAKFSYAVNVDENIDLKSVQVPALIIQPFIENAIWHGIVPRGSGGHISVDVVKKASVIEIIIDDNGIGREASQQNKSASSLAHQSRGVNLTQSRLELNNLLQQRQAELEVIDKKDEQGISRGTTVAIKIKEE